LGFAAQKPAPAAVRWSFRDTLMKAVFLVDGMTFKANVPASFVLLAAC